MSIIKIIAVSIAAVTSAVTAYYALKVDPSDTPVKITAVAAAATTIVVALKTPVLYRFIVAGFKSTKFVPAVLIAVLLPAIVKCAALMFGAPEREVALIGSLASATVEVASIIYASKFVAIFMFVMFVVQLSRAIYDYVEFNKEEGISL